MAHTFNSTIIREYDIRGVVGKTLHIADATALGRVYGTMVKRAGGDHIMVGYDGRTHSPDFEAALVEGLISTGVRVERIGLGPTPMLYFATYHANASAGIMVTGSHNPPDQNGFKMLMAKHLKGGGPIYGDAIKKLASMAEAGDYEKGQGSEKKIDVREAYVARLLKDFKTLTPLKVVWDCGNGAGGEIVHRLTSVLPGQHTLLFSEIDGTFPNHHPDPTVAENLRDLQEAVKKNRADLGVAFDGDADRIGAIDGHGRIIAGDQLLAIYSAEVLKTHPGATIIADVKASQVLFDYVEKLGGKPVMWKTGHSLIKSKMAETKSPLAGEMSGHVFFADKYYGYDDAIYAAVRLLTTVSTSGKTLAQWRDELPSTVSTPELRFPVAEERKFKVIEEVKTRLKKSGAKVNDIDGVRVMTEDGWWLLRASNTQAVLVARAESQSTAGLERLKNLLSDQLEASGLSLPKV
ncbi:MAG TPA: phosphomannomutase/phosphoglucomutase [Alphaproteobacteria bacterium]|nr:phosphomannomutase/phosphoglucomutase [Alphaproteobacteria bacterium]